MGFVQADPIRAPARAQDLILRHRVKGYRTGDLERRYASLSIAEDVFGNYGYVTRAVQGLMHPRPDLRVPAEGNQSSSAVQREKEQMLLEFVEKRGVVHPREVEEHFAHGTVRNYWGGTCDHAHARRVALPRAAAGGATREGHPGLPHTAAWTGAAR
ncbi:MAG: winged helix DNA-binding domain-containing protein [Verrucomicrobiota bacterium]|nr:winged helix DNA-binding domain-containing protein [Verrucomicrobiota bacterium]